MCGWSTTTTCARISRSGMATPWDRFKLARPEPPRPVVEPSVDPAGAMAPSATRRVAAKGTISFASAHYKVGVWLAGQNVEVVCDGALVQIHHRGVLVATHARRHDPAKQSAGMSRSVARHRAPDASDGLDGDRDTQGRFIRQRLLRRCQLSGGEQVPPSSGPSRRHRGPARDLHRRTTDPTAPDQARPHPRTRGARQPRRSTPQNQRRLNPTRRVNQVPKPPRQTGTEA